MNIKFAKYHGTGNDFVIIDNREYGLSRNDGERYAQWCGRRFGVGADGLIFVQEKVGYDFEMVYFNADGNESSMCGNGGRCVMAFANQIGLVGGFARFVAIDGAHEARLLNDGSVSLKMQNVNACNTHNKADFVLNTGSPHYVRFVKNLDTVDVFKDGRGIRNSIPFRTNGINVNFVETVEANTYKVATYERGVEAETFSCGTGVVAVAMAAAVNEGNFDKAQSYDLLTKGGRLSVNFERTQAGFENIWLTGNAVKVFEGWLSH